MPTEALNPKNLGQDVDWVGNNAAFTCPVCSKVFIVSGQLHKKGRDCPACGGSRAFVEGGAIKGGADRLANRRMTPQAAI